MKEFSKYVGMDVHKETIAVAVAEARGGEVRYLGEIANSPEAMQKLVKQLRKGDAGLSFCYEAGPCGYGLHRQLTELGWDCQVVAPSLIPKKAGDRVKTDRRDSLSLARLHRAGELTAVWVPDDAQEALRDLTRAREDMKHLQRQAKQRLLAFLLRHGRSYDGKGNWTQAHYRWLEGVKFGPPVQQIVFQEYVDTVKLLSQRVAALDQQLADAAGPSVWWPVIEALMALRGVSLLTATTIVAEIGDLKRFASAPQLMAYYGAGAERVLQRRQQVAWRHHQDRQRSCAPRLGRSRLDLSSPGAQDGVLAAARRAHVGSGAGHCVEGAKALVRALPVDGRPRQTEGTGMHCSGPRIGRVHLGDWASIAASQRPRPRSIDHVRTVRR